MKFRQVVSDRLERRRQVPCYERAHQEGVLVDQACWKARRACLERLEKDLYKGWTSIDTSCD